MRYRRLSSVEDFLLNAILNAVAHRHARLRNRPGAREWSGSFFCDFDNRLFECRNACAVAVQHEHAYHRADLKETPADMAASGCRLDRTFGIATIAKKNRLTFMVSLADIGIMPYARIWDCLKHR